MFLVRSAFWLSVVILLIPADPETGESPRVSLVNAFMAARAAVADLSGFCGRNPDVCVTGGAAVDIFAEKAQNGVDMIYQYFGEAEPKPATVEGDRGTLSNDDLTPPWHGEADGDGGAA